MIAVTGSMLDLAALRSAGLAVVIAMMVSISMSKVWGIKWDT